MYTPYDVALCEAEIIPEMTPASVPKPMKNSVSLFNISHNSHQVFTMKLSMSSLDIMVCARELKNAIGARVDKVYELGGVFVICMRTSGKGRLDLLIEPGRRVHLTGMQYKFPKQPKMYAMLLRKHLEGAQLVGVEQPDFERILELRFRGRGERVLIAELFGTGNLVLCDEGEKIIQPYRSEEWRHRIVKAGEKYKYPPSRADIEKLDTTTLREAVADAPDIVRGLATNLNIGGQLAEEICARAEITKSSTVADLSEPQLKGLLDAAAGLLSQEPAPNIVYDDGEVIDVLPFDFAIYRGMRTKRFSSFNEALDEYFGAMTIKKGIAKQKKKLEDGLEAIRSRLAEQEAHLAELEKEAFELKRRADLIKAHHAQLDDSLRKLSELRRKRGWQAAIKEMEEARASGEEWAKSIKKVDAKAGAVDVELRGQEIRLDMRMSAFKNASKLYDRYKRLSEKVVGAKRGVGCDEKGVGRPARGWGGRSAAADCAQAPQDEVVRALQMVHLLGWPARDRRARRFHKSRGRRETHGGWRSLPACGHRRGAACRRQNWWERSAGVYAQGGSGVRRDALPRLA